ncbi:MAG TPA: RIP metalloprotease RseP [Desulfobacterales bacterium]|nr:RIP metalloprotease RseP [Desulfobacterales bacterium]
MNTVISFIIVLGALIFVHELGHFLFAKLFRVRVLKFSLGFGPKLIGKKIGETEYVLSAFPLGGFVKMFGENPDEQEMGAREKDRSFAHKPVYQRFLIVFAGPLFNFIFPIMLFFPLFFFQGVPVSQDTTRIGGVEENSPAAKAGVKADDIIISINDRKTLKWLDVNESVKESGGAPLQVVVMRSGARVELTIVPKMDTVRNLFGEAVEDRFMIGIRKADEFVYEDVNIFEAFKNALQQTWFYIYLTGLGFIKLIQQVVPASEMGGPILIAQMAGEQAKAGWVNLLYFTSLLSVNLGILNLLPVPVLDGGHLAFLTLEGIRKKPLSERKQIFAQQIGLGLLGALMVFVFYNDIMRILGG